MSDLPQSAVARTAKLAAPPLGYAGRTALGLGKRALGRPAELIAAEVQSRTAEQLFKVLGELRGRAVPNRWRCELAAALILAAKIPRVNPVAAGLVRLVRSLHGRRR